MARMFPKYGPQDTDSKKAEPDIYWRLNNQLSDEFVVIHSLPWLASVANEIDGRPVPTGEIDFLVLHPTLGILGVEVKGGHLRLDRTDFVYKKTGEKIQPLRQVRRGTHALARWLHESGILSFRIGYCVLFPDSEMRDDEIPPALVDKTVSPWRRIALDITHLCALGKHIEDIMRYWKQELDTQSLTRSKINSIVDLLLPSVDYYPCWQTRIQHDVVTWLKLTPEQSECLRKIENAERLVVTGWPGTGKTLLAVEYARRAAKHGLSVLFLTYNHKLSIYLDNELSNRPQVRVCTFHELCRQADKDSHRHWDEVGKEWYVKQGPHALKAATENGSLPNYDILVVDEGQAFAIDWWQTLRNWFSDKTIVVFCDETQTFSFESLTTVDEIVELIGAPPPYTLTLCLRSPKAVFNRLLQAREPNYQQYCPRPLEEDSLTELVVSDPQHTLEQTLEQLKVEGIPNDEIVVVSCGPSLPEISNSSIEVISAAKFRGLEKAVVIVWTSNSSDDNTLLCAYTRATSRCIVIYSAVEMLEGAYGGFGEAILEQNKGQIEEEAQAVLTTYRFARQRFDLIEAATKTTLLYWCSTWSSWVLQQGKFDQVSVWMWSLHLAVTTQAPVYFWEVYDKGKLSAYMSPIRLTESANTQSLILDLCKVCQALMPCFVDVNWGGKQAPTYTYRCAKCTQQESNAFDADLVTAQLYFDKVVAREWDIRLDDVRQLSIFLIALGRWR